jgi:Domain of unknown function (DUF3472)/Domain of unknown function (DUF5077)
MKKSVIQKYLKTFTAKSLILCTCFTFVYSRNAFPVERDPPFKSYVSIPMAGNSWGVTTLKNTADIITDQGVEGWNNREVKIHSYFKPGVTGKIRLAIRARVKSGVSKLRFQFGNESKTVSINNIEFDTLAIGTFSQTDKGYQKLIISGVQKSAKNYADITDLLIYEETTDVQLTYVKDDFYWGRRGPSVHLNYLVPETAGNIGWFYSELKIPEGSDVVGSYFMANGFGEGYFGIQVNSPTERRILFSVWSPFKTDHPEQIPEDEKVILLSKGLNVKAGNFGDEGSGGQSYRNYNWKPGVSYRFLLKAVPSENNSTDYSAYFYAPESGHWELIASFKRPKTTTWLKHLHSFLENFIPENGNLSRMGIYSNQWVCNSVGEWTELNNARFTADATARKGARADYSGGVLTDSFFLKNCGFFNENCEINTLLVRRQKHEKPLIDFSELP